MNTLDVELVLTTLDPHGPLSQSLKGFEPREQQRHMMRNVLDAYNRNAIALIEAGTGTGKSIAYLIPAMLWAVHNQQRTVISTNTITLQEQLVIKDIPLLAKALNLNIQAVLVKGMSNYVCLRKLEDARQEAFSLTPEELAELNQIEAWAQTTKEGSKSTLPVIPSHNSWERVCAESDTCSHNQCPHYKDCFFFQARRKAEDAQILVANHHLLFADLSIRAETENYQDIAVLPHYTRIVIDEAHHIEDVATEFFGQQISKIGMLRTLARITSEKQSKAQGKLPILRQKIIQSFPNDHRPEIISIENRLQVDLQTMRKDVHNKIQNAFQSFSEFADYLQNPLLNDADDIIPGDQKLRIVPAHHEHPVWKNSILNQGKELVHSINRYVQALRSLETDLKELKNDRFQEQTKGIRADIIAFASRLATQSALLEEFIFSELPTTKVRWIDSHRMRAMTNVSLIDADLDVSKKMVECLLEKFPTIVFCSATLTTNQGFDFFKKRLGIVKDKLPDKAVTENIYDSPFNYMEQALLTVPTDLPVPQDGKFTNEAAEQIWRAIQISRGGVFVLFTSYGMMRRCFDILEKRLTENRYNLFKQGDLDRQTILTKFKNTQKSVLFGTDSFWEGVDVVGEALRCVILVKLPFKVPTEPIIQARTEAILAAGGDPFFDYALPNAIVKFKQGFGRLIRNKKDRGCIVCLDTRLVTKGYGKQFINSLPNCGKSFAPSEHIEQHMRDFYRRTHYLVMK